mmetsp:Transcript_79536/g.125454  ORF Transcript_79536/g.125454 Transcript_79536/m.125454 type:complete len:767 (+) Transcript_79536:139-2439(+)
MSLASMTVAELWRAVGLELSIFMVTLVFALIIRTSSNKKANGKLGQGFVKPGFSGNHSEKSTAVSGNVPRGGNRTTNERGYNSSERSQERIAERRCGQDREPWQVIDEVVQSMREMPGTKSANKALTLYADMQANRKDLYIIDAARRSSHSALDFYTTLVQCSIRIGKYNLVEHLLDDMSQQGVPRTLTFYESTMKQLAGQKQYHLALSMYDHLASDGLEASPVTCSCLISFAVEVGELQRAIGFFEKLSSLTTPSIRAYMTVLRVHAKRQDWPSSVNVFQDMRTRKVPLDSLVLNVILATGVAADQIEGVEQLLLEADTFKPPISDVVSYNTLIKGYAQRNDALKAIQVINRMVKRGLTTNAISFNTAMDAAVRSLRIQEAWDLLKDMRKAGFRPDKFTCSILVKGLGKQPVSDHIKNSLELLVEVNSICDATLRSSLYHSVLEAAAQVPDTTMLVNTFSQMRSHQVALTANAYRLLVQALGQEGDVKLCNQIWQQMLSEDIRPQACIFVALLESHLRQGQVDGALSAFESLRTSIKSEASTRRADGTWLLEECRVAFIRSLCRISREPEATHTYLQARSDGALSNIDSATGMMLARVQADCGNLSHAWMTIEDMIDLGHKPNEATLHSFLSACIKQSHTVYAKALLTKTSSNSITLSQATYIMFLKLYGRCQQLQDAIAVFDIMREDSSKKIEQLKLYNASTREPGYDFDETHQENALCELLVSEIEHLRKQRGGHQRVIDYYQKVVEDFKKCRGDEQSKEEGL